MRYLCPHTVLLRSMVSACTLVHRCACSSSVELCRTTMQPRRSQVAQQRACGRIRCMHSCPAPCSNRKCRKTARKALALCNQTPTTDTHYCTARYCAILTSSRRGQAGWNQQSSQQQSPTRTCLPATSSSKGSMAGTPSLSCTLTGSSTSKSTHVTWLGPLVL